MSILELRALNELTLSVHGVGHLEPKDDVTPLEAVHLMMLLIGGSFGRNINLVKFISDHNLWRHFRPEVSL